MVEIENDRQLPFTQFKITTEKGNEYILDLNEVFKIVVVFILAVAAYNVGTYVELETLKFMDEYCQNQFLQTNTSVLP